jgi:hypothetical protein
MTQALTDRATFAAVLVQLVRNRCASGANRTSRTGLQSTIPVNERPAVRRGIEGLIEAGVLVMHGEDLGFTQEGLQFLAHVQQAQGRNPPVERQRDDTGALERILGAIEQDDRFEPYRDLDEVRTLPSRLENYRAHRRQAVSPMRWILMGLSLVVLVALVLFIVRRAH